MSMHMGQIWSQLYTSWKVWCHINWLAHVQTW